jgi:DUF1365 family protein
VRLDLPLDRIAEGVVVHERDEPLAHAFRYPIWMLLADVDRLDALAATSPWLSVDRPNLLSLRARACLPDHAGATLRARIESAVRAGGHPPPSGALLLLQQPASWGFGFNPVRFVFCLDAAGAVEYVLGEINNTPWNERHTYVLRAGTPAARVRFEFDKAFHVSPFNPMTQRYGWDVALDDARIDVCMQLVEHDRVAFRAGLHLRTQPVTAAGLRRGALRHAGQPLVQFARIYRQAAALWLRRAPFHDHPKHGVQP